LGRLLFRGSYNKNSGKDSMKKVGVDDSLALNDRREEYAKLLKDSVEQVLSSFSNKVERISIFGSYARGVSDLFTDLDILIIMNTDKSFVERTKEIYSSLSLPVDADILCYTPEEFERIKSRAFFKKILAEEVILYEKRSPRRRKKVA